MTSFSLPRPSRPVEVLLRTALALLGGYALVRGCIAVGIVAAVGVGMDYGNAHMLAMIIAFPCYLAVVLWAFATRRLWRAVALLIAATLLVSLVTQLLGSRLFPSG